MIDLQTGLPGAGKTLYSIWRIKQKSEAEGRPVYYSGISDLKLPWIELEDPTKWYECPANSIIVIDECQRVFRPRGNGSAVPEHVAKLETHRHLGIDLVFITQHPMLVDSNVRRLVGKHYHSVRAFGQQKARVFEFESVKENPVAARSTGIEHNFKYPKEIFDYYKSAEVHTHKKKIPARVYAMFVVPVVAIALIGFTVSWFYDRTQGVPIGGTAPTAQHAGTGAPSTSSAGRTREGKLTTAQYLQEQQPRIQGLAYTAPVYDEVTRPTQAPYPAACLTLRNECRCYSQQGTRLAVEQSLCDKIVQDGFFLAWDARTPEQRDRRHEANRNAPLLASASTATPSDLVIGAPAPREGLSTAPSSTTPQTTSQPTQQPYQPRVPANSPWRAP